MLVIASTTSPALAQSLVFPATDTSSFIATMATQAIATQAAADTLDADLKDLATKAALKHHIATSTLFNLVHSESRWDPDSPGDWNAEKGRYCSWGLTQQNICAHPEITKEQATDPAWALDKAAGDIEDGLDYIYTSCNCYSLVWTRKHALPRMIDIEPNSKARVGAVAIFYYLDRETGLWVKHIAYVLEVHGTSITIIEANKDHCKVDTRVVPMSDPHLAGFWH